MEQLQLLLDQYKKGWSLPRDFYMSKAVLDQEAAAIWQQNWLFAGFSCEIPEPGDYFTYAQRVFYIDQRLFAGR